MLRIFFEETHGAPFSFEEFTNTIVFDEHDERPNDRHVFQILDAMGEGLISEITDLELVLNSHRERLNPHIGFSGIHPHAYLREKKSNVRNRTRGSNSFS